MGTPLCTRLEIDVCAADGPGDLEAVGHGQERRRRRHRRHHRHRRRHSGNDDHLCSRLRGRGESLAGRMFRRLWIKHRNYRVSVSPRPKNPPRSGVEKL